MISDLNQSLPNKKQYFHHSVVIVLMREFNILKNKKDLHYISKFIFFLSQETQWVSIWKKNL